jgi:transcriptional regulator with XRE-family HTH domain
MEHANVEEVIGRRLRELRQAAGMSQRDVAALIPGWRQSLVSKMESGNRPMRLNELAALAAIFGVTLPELIGTGRVNEAQTYRQMERVIRERVAAEILRPVT